MNITRLTLAASVLAFGAGLLWSTPAAAASPAAIDYGIMQGILAPDEEGEVHAALPVTRIDFVLKVVDDLYLSPMDSKSERMAQANCYRNIAPSLPVTFTRLFGDVPNDAPYAPRLCIALEAGLVGGDRDGNFRPFDAITVAEAAKVLAGAQGFTYPTHDAPTKPWYWSSMEALRQRGAIAATDAPSAVLDRGMMATMFHALRDAQRYPLTRIIGMRLDAPLCAGLACGTETTGGMAVTSTGGGRRAPAHVSARTLRRQVREARKQATSTPVPSPHP